MEKPWGHVHRYFALLGFLELLPAYNDDSRILLIKVSNLRAAVLVGLCSSFLLVRNVVTIIERDTELVKELLNENPLQLPW